MKHLVLIFKMTLIYYFQCFFFFEVNAGNNELYIQMREINVSGKKVLPHICDCFNSV